MVKKSLMLLVVSVFSCWAVNLNNTVWNTNWDVMYFWQTGTSVSGEYMYDDGILTGTLVGDTLRGWWRESNNSKECGPSNSWSGPVVMLFAPDGKSFTGSWAYCATDPSTLDPNGSGWTGTLKEGVTSYTQQECVDAGRYWCNNACSITPCDVAVTQQTCEASGRFWCTDTCTMVDCNAVSVDKKFSTGSASRPGGSSRGRQPTVDIRGRRITNAGSAGVVIGPDGRASVLNVAAQKRR